MLLRSSDTQIGVEVGGSLATPTQINFSSQLEIPFAIRIRVCDLDTYDNAANATIAAIAGKGDVIKTHTAGKDLEIHSDAALDGEIWINLTSSVNEQVTLRIGPPELGNLILDYASVLNVGHGYIAINSGGYVLTGSDVTFVRSLVLTNTSGSHTYTGNASSLKRSISVDSGSYTYVGNDVDLKPTTFSVDSGSYTYTGNDVTLTYVP